MRLFVEQLQKRGRKQRVGVHLLGAQDSIQRDETTIQENGIHARTEKTQLEYKNQAVVPSPAHLYNTHCNFRNP